jgi:replication-associated recombination protein RarA
MPRKPLEDTVGGHGPYEAVSALQKAIRRGELDNAAYWTADLLLSGQGWWIWRRLFTICSEDVGPAWPEGPAVIRALYETWRNWGKEPLYVFDAVARLVRAPKNRLIDNLAGVHMSMHDELHREVPDEALDAHTIAGRRLGRMGADFFYDVAAKTEGTVEDDDAELYERLMRKVYDSGYRDDVALPELQDDPEREVKA